MTAIIVGALIGIAVGASLGALLFGGLAYSKGFEQGMCDGEAKGLRSVLDSVRVHAPADTAANGTRASGNGVAASLRSEQVRNDG